MLQPVNVTAKVPDLGDPWLDKSGWGMQRWTWVWPVPLDFPLGKKEFPNTTENLWVAVGVDWASTWSPAHKWCHLNDKTKPMDGHRRPCCSLTVNSNQLISNQLTNQVGCGQFCCLCVCFPINAAQFYLLAEVLMTYFGCFVNIFHFPLLTETNNFNFKKLSSQYISVVIWIFSL